MSIENMKNLTPITEERMDFLNAGWERAKEINDPYLFAKENFKFEIGDYVVSNYTTAFPNQKGIIGRIIAINPKYPTIGIKVIWDKSRTPSNIHMDYNLQEIYPASKYQIVLYEQRLQEQSVYNLDLIPDLIKDMKNDEGLIYIGKDAALRPVIPHWKNYVLSNKYTCEIIDSTNIGNAIKEFERLLEWNTYRYRIIYKASERFNERMEMLTKITRITQGTERRRLYIEFPIISDEDLSYYEFEILNIANSSSSEDCMNDSYYSYTIYDRIRTKYSIILGICTKAEVSIYEAEKI